MFKLHIIQADHGNCYLLEYGASATRVQYPSTVVLRLIGANLAQRETMGMAAQAVDATAEIVLKQIRDYFEEMAPSHQ